MWLFCVVSIFSVAAAYDNNIPNVAASRNDANGQCSYTITVPAGQCLDDSDRKLSAKIDALDKLNQQQRRQQQLALVELNYKLQKYMSEQNARIQQLEDIIKGRQKQYFDCAQYILAGQNVTSGVYNITLEHSLSPLCVWCDMDTEKGGWTVIQRRQDGSVDFFNDWSSYKKGFGNIDGEYWLGNDDIYYLTNQTKYSLRVDMWDFDGNYYWAAYENFYIENEANKYTLHVGTYSGTAGDTNGLTYHNNMRFSTKDRDNDKSTVNCSIKHKGGFWYDACYFVNLNGKYYASKYTGDDSINWYDINASTMALKKVEMKVRPMTFQKK